MIKITIEPIQQPLLIEETSPVDLLCETKAKLIRQIILELGAATAFYLSAYYIDQNLYESALLGCAFIIAMKASCSLYELKKLNDKIDRAVESAIGLAKS